MNKKSVHVVTVVTVVTLMMLLLNSDDFKGEYDDDVAFSGKFLY